MCTTDAAAVHILAGLRAQRMPSACSAVDGVFSIVKDEVFLKDFFVESVLESEYSGPAYS